MSYEKNDLLIKINQVKKKYKDTSSGDFFLDRSRIYYGEGKLDSALADINKALKKNSKLSEAYVIKGRICHELGQLDEAEKAYFHVFLTTNANCELSHLTDVLYFIEYCKKEAGKNIDIKYFTSAINHLTNTIKKSPSNFIKKLLIRLYVCRAEVHFEQDDINHAIIDLTEALEIQKSPELLYFRSVCYMVKKEYILAMRDIKNIFEVNDASRDIRINSLHNYIVMSIYLSCISSDRLRKCVMNIKKMIDGDKMYDKISRSVKDIWDAAEKARIAKHKQKRPLYISRPTRAKKSKKWITPTSDECKHGLISENCPKCASWAPHTYSMRWDD